MSKNLCKTPQEGSKEKLLSRDEQGGKYQGQQRQVPEEILRSHNLKSFDTKLYNEPFFPCHVWYTLLNVVPYWMWRRQGFGKIGRSWLRKCCCICKWEARGEQLEGGKQGHSAQCHHHPQSGRACRSKQRSYALNLSWIVWMLEFKN